MQVKLICLVCSSDFEVPHWRKGTAKYCSSGCQRVSLKAKPNTYCTYCNSHFHKKQSHKDKVILGNFCSLDCLSLFKKDYFKGSNNHQYGLKGCLNSSFKGSEIQKANNKLVDIKIYVPNHPNTDKSGRVSKHRYLVENNYQLYDAKYFEILEGKYYLKKEIEVHHIDENHDNNSIDNLMPVTKGEHRRLHNIKKPQKRGDNGKFIKNDKRD